MISAKKGTAETRYVYDSLGRESELWTKHDTNQYQRTIKKFDHLDRVIEQTVKDENDSLFSKTTFRYDVDGNQTHVIIHDENGTHCVETQFDYDKRPVKIIAMDGTQTINIYCDDFINDLGQTVACQTAIDPKGIQTIKIMDACGGLVKEEKLDAYGQLIQGCDYCHDGEGNLLRRIDHHIKDGTIEKSITTEYEYDTKNQVIVVREAACDPLQKTTFTEYFIGGEISTIIKPNGVVLSHEYDALHRLTKMYSSDHSVHYVYSYDLNNNVIQVQDLVNRIETNRTFDENNQMVAEKLATGHQFGFKYDSSGRIKEMNLPDTSQVIYSYDAVNLRSIERRKCESSFRCHYQHNMAGLTSKFVMPNDLGTIDYGYDCNLKTVHVKSKHWSQIVPNGGYDPCGYLTEVTQEDIHGETISKYSYNPLNHLIKESGLSENDYAFDSMHNRTNKNGVENNVNSLNQLTDQGDVSYEYDLNGNQSKKSHKNETATFHYDALDRLIAVEKESQRTEYLYDSFHRRLSKKTYERQNDDWVETDYFTYLYQGNNEIGAVNQNGQIIEMRTLGLGKGAEIGAAVLMEIGSQTFVPIHDLCGNVVTLLDATNGEVVEAYRYSAYGEEQIFDSNGYKKSTAINAWRFSSKRADPETGWIYYGRRYYDAEVGKWTSPDPLGFVDSPNVYCFVLNNPLKYIDPDGRAALTNEDIYNLN